MFPTKDQTLATTEAVSDEEVVDLEVNGRRIPLVLVVAATEVIEEVEEIALTTEVEVGLEEETADQVVLAAEADLGVVIEAVIGADSGVVIEADRGDNRSGGDDRVR